MWVCGVTVRDVAVLAMLEDDAECACVWFSRGFGVGDWECDGVRGARAAGMGTRPFGCGRRGVAVWVDEEDAEESDAAGEGARDGVDDDVDEDEEEGEGLARAAWTRDADRASERSCRRDATKC